MSDSTHTPGLLVVRGGWSIYAADGKTPVADTCLNESVAVNDEANARRLVACWNACDGMEDPAIEIATLRAEVERLRIVADRVAGLNPDAGEIGAGMLVQLVDAARAALKGGA